MGTDPTTSAINRYLQSWDVPNLFVMGASAFPQNAGYNPTGTVARARLLVGRCDPEAIPQEPGTSRPCLRTSHGGLRESRSPRCSRCRAWSRSAVHKRMCRARAWTRRTSSRSSEGGIWRSRATARAVTLCLEARLSPAGGDGTPFGVVVGANITPDRETGIGAWSDELFVSALREGKGHGGSLLYPAMPYPYYTKVTERDALAIRAFSIQCSPSAIGSSRTSCRSPSTFARK